MERKNPVTGEKQWSLVKDVRKRRGGRPSLSLFEREVS